MNVLAEFGLVLWYHHYLYIWANWDYNNDPENGIEILIRLQMVLKWLFFNCVPKRRKSQFWLERLYYRIGSDLFHYEYYFVRIQGMCYIIMPNHAQNFFKRTPINLKLSQFLLKSAWQSKNLYIWDVTIKIERQLICAHTKWLSKF